MIDIKSELLAIEKKREQDFISIIELLDFLKEHNPNASLPEIATYLLIKLEPHDIRKTNEELWGNEAFEIWDEQHGIGTYKMPKSISDNPIPRLTSYFITALETVRDNEPDPLWDNPTAGAFLREEQKDLFIDRKQIETILGIDTLDKEALNKKYRNEEYVAVAMALTKTDEFVKNTDINKSPVGLAERLVMQQEINQKSDQITQLQARIAELEKELADKTITPQEETGDKYTSTERQTHLQAIATLSFRLAESNKSSLMTTTGKTNNSKIAEILEKEAKELFTDPKTKETFRKRISEAINTFQPQAE